MRIINMELKDTVEMMNSSDYKERLRAECFQLKIRCNKLDNMYDNWDNLSFTPTCDKALYAHQINIMKHYLHILKQRAKIEGIEIEDYA